MSQHDYVIGNDTAANVRADINTALLAIASNNSGASAPATTYANQWWYDSTNDILKIRAEANDAWISVAKLDQTLDQFFPIVGGVEVTATGTELNFVDGVTSAIQTQLNAKAPSTSPTLTTPIISGNLGAGGANYGTSGQVLTSGGTGASPSWSTISAGGMTLLGTLTTTSGSTQTLSGLTLTSYKQIVAVVKNVSASANFLLQFAGLNMASTVTSTNAVFGILTVDLTTGVWVFPATIALPVGETNNATIADSWRAGIQSTITTASTSITFNPHTGTFDAGTITIYGVK